jgi:hypothetical protein
VSFQIIDPKQIIRQARSESASRRRNHGITPGVTLTAARKNSTQQFILSRAFTRVLGEDTTHVAIEYDDETKVMSIRPSVYGEPAFKLQRAGAAKPGENANRVFNATSLRRHFGIGDGVKGKFKAKVVGGRILVDLKPAFKKSASKAA